MCCSYPKKYKAWLLTKYSLSAVYQCRVSHSFACVTNLGCHRFPTQVPLCMVSQLTFQSWEAGQSSGAGFQGKTDRFPWLFIPHKSQHCLPPTSPSRYLTKALKPGQCLSPEQVSRTTLNLMAAHRQQSIAVICPGVMVEGHKLGHHVKEHRVRDSPFTRGPCEMDSCAPFHPEVGLCV